MLLEKNNGFHAFREFEAAVEKGLTGSLIFEVTVFIYL
jgi:hypothetical protein